VCTSERCVRSASAVKFRSEAIVFGNVMLPSGVIKSNIFLFGR